MARRSIAGRGLRFVLMLAALTGLVAVPLRAPTRAVDTTWQWYQVDTHVHSAVSGDALVDVGINSLASALGYDALFLSDHNGASSFHINFLTANHMVFEDTYTRWESGTYGSLDSSVNELITDPVNTGTHALHLASSSTDYGETYVWAKRGPNFRSGDLILRVSIYPTRIDPGSGVYVSASIGGDPTVVKSPYGYTTQAGVVSPGKTTVLVWQLGSARTPSSDPNARVLTYSLGDYTLNTWNHYTINVSQALADIPPEDRPLDYNGLIMLKMAVAANGGTAEAYFDTYTIDALAPVGPAEEYVYRTGIVDDFNTPDFKIFPSYEMGQQKHANRFNFGITDPSEYVSYQDGTDGILETQQSGYPAQLNHPGTTITIQEAIDTQGAGADFVEVREQEWVDAWDAILQQGVIILGDWSSDAHRGLRTGKAATHIYAPALDFDALLQSLFEGRVYSARNHFSGRAIFNLDAASAAPYPARYPVYVSDAESTAAVHLLVTDGLKSNYTVRWVRNGSVIETVNPAASSYEATKAIGLEGPFTYVRAEVRSSSGSYRALTQPILFVDVPGLPAGMRYHVAGVTTANGRQYTRLYVKGITSSNWSSASEVLALTLENPAGSLVELHVVTGVRPQRIRVDGQEVPAAETPAEFEGATDSIWYYASGAGALYVKVRQANIFAPHLLTMRPSPPSAGRPRPPVPQSEPGSHRLRPRSASHRR